ncbi:MULTISPECIES: succinylglutamate desuccinylase/aspartoacylase family protein [unclassified Mesorhizobium]|uniref:succinylglutamate desuccinylase/aspartoacylase domain-containing protein n=1 Tax=unclassified Mesorhizobium TaxID=325217 RepID=UPI0013DFA390|nr:MULTISPECIES: succinylglutamate desuccinylase/aspartoacylase family protein [unclassified Mesorhizobium]
MNEEQSLTAGVLFGLADPLPAEGKVSGYVKVPYSTDISAYGFIPVPIVIIGNGVGPTALLMGGSQGDEYEGQIALSRLACDLQPADMSGRVIILPMANSPAARAGLRNSPIDGLNLNRIYPGDVRGRPTAMIASFIERHLMTASDIVVDLHSGGRSLRYQTCATIMDHSDDGERTRRLALAYAFGAPMILVSQGFEERNSSGAALRSGAVRIGVEVGGGESLEKELVDVTYTGLQNVLRWAGILPASSETAKRVKSTVCAVTQVPDYVYAQSKGLFEVAVKLDDRVEAGAVAGRIYDPLNPLNPPCEVKFSSTGRVVCTRALGPTDIGDCVAHLAHEYVEHAPGELERARSSEWVKDRYRGRKPRVRPQGRRAP